MAGRTDPPEGTPGGTPGAGDEEYRSTVFDESFVRAARIEEFSARERLADHTTAVRARTPEPGPGRAVPKQGIALALIILLAFAAAIYLGASNPYDVPRAQPAGPPAAALVALAPEGEVPGDADLAALWAGAPAGGLGAGAGAVDLPDPRATAHFSREQVLTALTLAKQYVVASALTPQVLAGVGAVPVRELLGPDQQRQLDLALGGQHPTSRPTDWLVRFDPGEAVLADPQVRVDGELSFAEVADDTLEVGGRHVFAYAVRPAGTGPEEPAALFVVQRQVRLQFGEQELRQRNVVLRQADTLAGPLDCAADHRDELHPLLPGTSAARTAPGTTYDPYDLTGERGALCGTFDLNRT
ncbi:hypothetical protein RM780_11700 [Streptomyces sp. DSM 44917]|uniref:Uncharacterized protein n=1 Tax=Streptomyces boetiae TaxID=3075541 RepID=A0ABU2L7S8_9ACTN|nr:hypothetical protein [Streptomyces sp. DSM 44917]MDT0307624.1 hypothetical protein [Streptomyces sp. DSM 44917]